MAGSPILSTPAWLNAVYMDFNALGARGRAFFRFKSDLLRSFTRALESKGFPVPGLLLALALWGRGWWASGLYKVAKTNSVPAFPENLIILVKSIRPVLQK